MVVMRSKTVTRHVVTRIVNPRGAYELRKFGGRFHTADEALRKGQAYAEAGDAAQVRSETVTTWTIEPEGERA